MNFKGMTGAALVAAVMALAACGGGGGGGGGGGAPPPPPAPADTTPPETTLSGGPTTPTTQRTASFTLASTEANSTFEASFDGSAFVTVSSPYAISGITDGVHSVTVRARDAAGNVDASPAFFAWTVDTTAPNVRVQFPGLAAYTNLASIRLRGLADDPNLGTISGISVNGVAATSTDNFRSWTATMPVATGTNTYTIATTDGLGNTNSNAATVTITNRGLALFSAGNMVIDSARNRLLVDTINYGIASIRLSDGVAEVFSGQKRGTGGFADFNTMVLDTAHNRLIANAPRVMAIDLDTGDRTPLTTGAPSGQEALGYIAYDAAHELVYASHPNPQRVVAINLANNSRRIVTSSTMGTGPTMTQPLHVVFDTSSAGGGQRLLVSDVGTLPGEDQSRIFAVDIATGNRTVLSTSAATAVGTGVTMYGIGSMTLDAANNRVLVASYSRDEVPRVIAINLTTGDRSLFASVTGRAVPSAQFAYDGAGQRAYLSMADRARVLRLDFATQQFVRFYDTSVGTGPVPAALNDLQYDGIMADQATLILTVQTSAYGLASGLLRFDPATGARSQITGDGVGSGPNFYFAQGGHRNWVSGALENRLIVYDCGTLPRGLFAVDPANGNRSFLSTPAVTIAASYSTALENERLITATRAAYPDEFTLSQINLTSGAVTPISGPGVGSGPGFSTGTFGAINAIGIHNPSNGDPKKYILASSDGAVTAVDPTTGNRTRVFPTGNTQPLEIDDMDIDLARGRAFLLSPYGTVYTVDLANGALGLVTGSDANFSNSIGGGPEIQGYGARLRLSPFNDVAFAVSNHDSIVAVDLATGQRAIVSR